MDFQMAKFHTRDKSVTQPQAHETREGSNIMYMYILINFMGFNTRTAILALPSALIPSQEPIAPETARTLGQTKHTFRVIAI